MQTIVVNSQKGGSGKSTVCRVLAVEASRAGLSVYLIDFDRCALRKAGFWQDDNLVRLRRSLEKTTYSIPRDRFTEADWHGLLDGYRQFSGEQPLTQS